MESFSTSVVKGSSFESVLLAPRSAQEAVVITTFTLSYSLTSRVRNDGWVSVTRVSVILFSCDPSFTTSRTSGADTRPNLDDDDNNIRRLFTTSRHSSFGVVVDALREKTLKKNVVWSLGQKASSSSYLLASRLVGLALRLHMSEGVPTQIFKFGLLSNIGALRLILSPRRP